MSRDTKGRALWLGAGGKSGGGGSAGGGGGAENGPGGESGHNCKRATERSKKALLGF